MTGIVTRSVETKAVLQPESEVEAKMATIANNCGENEINATIGQICRIDDTDATIEQICENKGITPQLEQHNMEGKQKFKLLLDCLRLVTVNFLPFKFRNFKSLNYPI